MSDLGCVLGLVNVEYYMQYVCMCTRMRAVSVMSDSATPWTVSHQAPLSIEFSRQE